MPSSPPPPQGSNGQPSVWQYGPPPKKSKKKWGIGCLVLVVLALLLFGGCAALMSGDESDPTPASTPAPAPEGAPEDAPEETQAAGDTVRLVATGTGSGTVMWGDSGSNNTQAFTGAWEKEVPADDDSMFTLIVTDDSMDDSAEVSCELYVNGELVDSATGSGSFGSASCVQPLW